ncbi:hypothetical protein Tco_0854512, partial [Tanacetum coccineum]
TKKYAELSPAEKIQTDYDMNAINIILQGLPTDIYSLVNHHRVAKDLWEKVQLLMQGTSLTKQERECKLYDVFDKFTHIKEESLHLYYLRFTQLINDINIYNIKLEQFQVNTKFLNSLPLELSKFVTDVKLVKDLHTAKFDQLYAYLEQQELHANEVRLMRERNQDPFTLSRSTHPTQHYSTTYPSIPLAITYPPAPYPNAYSLTGYQEIYPQPQSVTQIEYIVSTVNQQTYLAEFPQMDSSLAVPVFKQGDDPSDAINKMMGDKFLMLLELQEQELILQEGHMARHCLKPKRKRDATWFREKVLLVKAQGNGKVLIEEELEFLADPSIAEGLVTQSVITYNTTYQADDLDAYDSDCDEISTAKAVLMANLFSYGLDFLSKVQIFDNTYNDMLNQSGQEMSYSEPSHFVEHSENEIHSDSNIIP